MWADGGRMSGLVAAPLDGLQYGSDNKGVGRSQMRAFLVGCVLVVAGVLTLGQPVAAQGEEGGLAFTATVDGTPLGSVDANDPLELRPGEELPIEIEISNDTGQDLFVRGVRLDSQVLGLTFFTFTTRIDARVDDGDTVTRSFLVDLGDLGEQAVGLLPAQLSLIDEDRSMLVGDSFPVDVRGSITSVYGLFGIIVAIITALLLAAALVRLAAHRLPANRWSRAARFGIPGFGVGMTLTFTLSALRLLTPGAGAWVTAVLVCGAIGLVVGYLSPDPRDEGDDDQLIQELLNEYHARQREGSLAAAKVPTGRDSAGDELVGAADPDDPRATSASSADLPPVQ